MSPLRPAPIAAIAPIASVAPVATAMGTLPRRPALAAGVTQRTRREVDY